MTELSTSRPVGGSTSVFTVLRRLGSIQHKSKHLVKVVENIELAAAALGWFSTVRQLHI